MGMEIGAAAAGQLTATRSPDKNEPIDKIFEKLSSTEKVQEKPAQDDQQQMMLAEHTGKGQNIDIFA